MDRTRRDFFRNFGAKTAGVAATVITPTLAHAEQFSEQIGKVAADLGEKITESTSELGEQIRGVSNRIDASALMMSYQQAQIHLIFLLLLISFAIDGGMTFFWLL